MDAFYLCGEVLTIWQWGCLWPNKINTIPLNSPGKEVRRTKLKGDRVPEECPPTGTTFTPLLILQGRDDAWAGRRRSSVHFLEKLKELRLEEDRKTLSLKNNAMDRIQTRIYPTQPPPPTATTISGRKRSSAGKGKGKRRSSSERRRSSTTRVVDKIVQRAKQDQEKKRQLLKRKSFIAKKKLSRRLKKRSREFESAAHEDE